MNSFERAVFMQTQLVCAMAKIEGMKALNMQREQRGESMAYSDADFFAIPKEYGIDHNSVVEYLNG